LFEWLARAYRDGRGQVEASVLVDDGGYRYDHPDAWVPGARRLVMRVVGPGVRAFYGPEQGSHVRDSISGGTEVVRVRVLPEGDLHAHLDSLSQRREQFVETLEHGTPQANPDALLPVVRRYAFDPPSAGAHAWIDVEDYPLMYAYRGRSASLDDALQTVWLLRMGASMTPHDHV
jgi:ATP-dependent Clp protease ATP-binding subunit ClpA/ATP-dependent Clp protease ATP-binding subunit ClpC